MLKWCPCKKVSVGGWVFQTCLLADCVPLKPSESWCVTYQQLFDMSQCVGGAMFGLCWWSLAVLSWVLHIFLVWCHIWSLLMEFSSVVVSSAHFPGLVLVFYRSITSKTRKSCSCQSLLETAFYWMLSVRKFLNNCNKLFRKVRK